MLKLSGNGATILERGGLAVLAGYGSTISLAVQLGVEMSAVDDGETVDASCGMAVDGAPVLCMDERNSPLMHTAIGKAETNLGTERFGILEVDKTPSSMTPEDWQDHVWNEVSRTNAGLLIVDVRASVGDGGTNLPDRAHKFMERLRREADHANCGVMLIKEGEARGLDRNWTDLADSVLELTYDRTPEQVLNILKADGLDAPIGMTIYATDETTSKSRVPLIKHEARSSWSESNVRTHRELSSRVPLQSTDRGNIR